MPPAAFQSSASLIGLVVFDRYELVSPMEPEARGDCYRALTRDRGVSAVVRMLTHPSFVGAARTAWGAIAERFEELRVIDHPHVERVLAGGVIQARDEELLCTVSQHIDGQSLHTYLRARGRLSIPEALSIGNRIALGLEAVHNAGLVHGDLRATNVLLAKNPPGSSGNRWPVLCDVAVNTLLSEALGGAFAARELAWAPESAAPEQIRGEPATEATDIHALGLLLYVMLTGGLPFPSDNPSEMLVAQLSRPPLPLSERCPDDFPAALENVVARCLARAPNERYSSVTALLDAFEALGADPSAVAAPPPLRRSMSPSAPPLPDAEISSQRNALRSSTLRRLQESNQNGASRSSRPPAQRGERASTMSAPRSMRASGADLRASQPVPPAPFEAPPSGAPIATGAEQMLLALRPLAFLVMGLTFLCGVAGGFVLGSARREEVAIGTLTRALPLVRPVRVRVRSTTPDAHVVIRGSNHALPFELEVPPGSSPEMMEVSARGFETRRMWMPFNESVDAQIDLVPLPTPVPAITVSAEPAETSRRHRSHRSRSSRHRSR